VILAGSVSIFFLFCALGRIRDERNAARRRATATIRLR